MTSGKTHKKSSVYTRGGDSGETSLLGGERVSKADQRIDTYGTVDELNSYIGLCTAHMTTNDMDKEKNILKDVQSNLFTIGSNLACNKEDRTKYKLPTLSKEKIVSLENSIDAMDSELPELKQFILPGGSHASASLHVARACCRKLERQMELYQKNGYDLPKNSLAYINRLSDFLFTLARYANFKQSVQEIIWNQ